MITFSSSLRKTRRFFHWKRKNEIEKKNYLDQNSTPTETMPELTHFQVIVHKKVKLLKILQFYPVTTSVFIKREVFTYVFLDFF